MTIQIRLDSAGRIFDAKMHNSDVSGDVINRTLLRKTKIVPELMKELMK
jgi:hypothetical protein